MKPRLKRISILALALACFFIAIIILIVFPAILTSTSIDLPEALTIAIAALFMTPCLYWSVKKRFKSPLFYQRFVSCYLCIFAISFSLVYASTLQDRFRGKDQYNYPLGQVFHPLGIFIKNPMGQLVISNIYSLLPLSAQYMMRVADESFMVFKVRKDFRIADYKSPPYCEASEPYDCFKDIYQGLIEYAPTNHTGSILMVAVGAIVIFKDKKRNEHSPTYTPSIYALRLAELTIMAHRSVLNGGRARDQLIGFPKREIASIPSPQLEGYLKKIDDTSYDSGKLIKLLGESYLDSQDSLDARLKEAILLERLDNEIMKKFFQTSHEKISEILNKTKSNKKYCSDEKCQSQVLVYQGQMDRVKQQYIKLGIIQKE